MAANQNQLPLFVRWGSQGELMQRAAKRAGLGNVDIPGTTIWSRGRSDGAFGGERIVDA